MAMTTTNKILFNINWDLNPTGARILELDALKCLNSNPNALITLATPIDASGSTSKTDPTLYFIRKRTLKLIDVWNKIVNSGFFNEFNASFVNSPKNVALKIVGANIRHNVLEFPFKTFETSTQTYAPVDFSTSGIFYRLVKFVQRMANTINWCISNPTAKINGIYFDTLQSSAINYNMVQYINLDYNIKPDNTYFISLMDELLNVIKDIISEQKLATLLLTDFAGLTFSTANGRAKIIALDAYKSNYAALAKIDLSYLNDETKVLAQNLIDTNSISVQRLYPQFGSIMSKTSSESWAFRNVAINTNATTNLNQNNFNLRYRPKYNVCTQLDMKYPLYFDPQFINWSNPNDRPYVFAYNAGILINIPDSLKQTIQASNFGTLQEAPDNQLNLSGYAWSIGTSNINDPDYYEGDDIKLKLPSLTDSALLHSIDKMDFLDNLTIYLKID